MIHFPHPVPANLRGLPMRRLIGIAALVLAGIGVGVYFGVPVLSRIWSGPVSEMGQPNPLTSAEEADARKKLAFESLVERLPKGTPIPPGKPLDADAKKRWDL